LLLIEGISMASMELNGVYKVCNGQIKLYTNHSKRVGFKIFKMKLAD